MSKPLTTSLPSTNDLEVTRLVRELHETEDRLRQLLGGHIDAVVVPNGQTFLLQAAQQKLLDDVKETERAAEVVRRNESMLSNAERIAHFGSWEIDLANLQCLDQSPLRWSDEVFRIFGHEPGKIEVSSENFFRAVHPEDRDKIKSAIKAAVHEGAGYALEHRIILPDGRLRYVYEEAQILKDPQSGKPTKMVGIVNDITERKAAERKLAEQAALLDQTRDAIILCDTSNTVLFWNKGAERVYGWTAIEATGQTTTRLVCRSPQKFDQAFEATFEKGEWSGELDHLTKDGASVIVESRWTLLRNAEGHPQSILKIDTDITARKKLEAQFLRAQRLESIGTLAAGIAHDLNNLLAPIVMGVDLLRHFGVEGPNRMVVDDIERSAKRGASLVRQVLSFARGMDGARIAVQVGDILKEMSLMISSTFPKNIQLKTEIADDLWLITGDSTQIQQVFLNLCLNARDAMPQGGCLTLSAENISLDQPEGGAKDGEPVGRYVLVKVIDTGCGIPPENLEKIFDPFFTTKELGNATGLGLATVLGIVRNHRGFLNVSSEPGKGSTFNLHLPVEAEEFQSEMKMEPREDAGWPRGNGEWILLIDDEPPILAQTRQILEAYGYHVLTAEHGATAVGLFAAHRDRIALVLIDMMMPVMDGVATTMALRQVDPRVRIIATSGLNANSSATMVSQAALKYFLPKPYTTAAILSILRKALLDEA